MNAEALLFKTCLLHHNLMKIIKQCNSGSERKVCYSLNSYIFSANRDDIAVTLFQKQFEKYNRERVDAKSNCVLMLLFISYGIQK